MNTKLLRQKILDLAIRGKLTEQKKSDGTTKDLLAQISKQWLVSSKQDSQKENASSNVIANTTSTSSRIPIRDPFAASKNSDDVIASTAKQSKKKTFAPKEIIPLDKSEAPFEIPENWEWVRLGDLCSSVSSGKTPSTIQKELWNGNVLWVTSKDVKQKYIYSTQICLSELGAQTMRLYPENTMIIVGRSGILRHTLPVTILKQKATINQDLKALVFLDNKLAEYIYAAIKGMEQDLLHRYKKAGTTVDNLNFDEFITAGIPLPPLAEQKRIVEAIESAFAEITAIENNQELLKKHIKQGRQKILDLAIRGKLTQQLKTDGTTKDLLAQIQDERRETKDERDAGKKDSSNVIASKAKQSKKSKPAEPKTIIPLNKDEAPFEIPENWEWVKLGDLSEKIQYGYNAPAKDTGRIKMVRITDIHDNAVEWDSVPFCDIDESEIPTYLLKKNDILFARTGGTVGKSFIVNEVPEDAVYAGYLIRTRYGKNINAQYMKYFMESNLYWAQLREGCIATAQPNCNGQTLGKMRIPLPPLAEQQRIVAAIESAFTEFDAMEKFC